MSRSRPAASDARTGYFEPVQAPPPGDGGEALAGRQTDGGNERPSKEPPASKGAEEQEEARERSAPPGHVLYGAIRREGEDELSRPGNEPTLRARAWPSS
jgi:hypothetical protein